MQRGHGINCIPSDFIMYVYADIFGQWGQLYYYIIYLYRTCAYVQMGNICTQVQTSSQGELNPSSFIQGQNNAGQAGQIYNNPENGDTLANSMIDNPEEAGYKPSIISNGSNDSYIRDYNFRKKNPDSIHSVSGESKKKSLSGVESLKEKQEQNYQKLGDNRSLIVNSNGNPEIIKSNQGQQNREISSQVLIVGKSRKKMGKLTLRTQNNMEMNNHQKKTGGPIDTQNNHDSMGQP